MRLQWDQVSSPQAHECAYSMLKIRANKSMTVGKLIAFDNFSRFNQVFSPLLMSKQTLISLQLQTPA